jgi:hypothetical protein
MRSLVISRGLSLGGSGAFTGLLALALVGCGNIKESLGSSRSNALGVPSRSTFPVVADAMQMHCGTLDCHGQPGRDMRIYGLRGLRYEAEASPLEGPTTVEEYDTSYWSIVGLEPEVMSQVVADQAAHPEWLTMIRKPRGIEEHKGGQLMVTGDSLDKCLVAWLGGRDPAVPCDIVVNTMRPYPDLPTP